MEKDKVIKKIKSKGYWEINIRPDIYNSSRIDKRNIKELMDRSKVSLRGWSYPVYGVNALKPYPITNGLENCFNSDHDIEFWRMTQSANFYHLLALSEDWMENIKYHNVWSDENELKGKKWLGVLGALYTLVEIFEFSRRLASQNVFDEEITLEIKLHDLKNRMLVIDSPNKAPFFSPHIAREDNPWNNPNQNIKIDELLNKDKLNEMVLDAFIDLVYLFSWDNPPLENLKGDIQKFLGGRM